MLGTMLEYMCTFAHRLYDSAAFILNSSRLAFFPKFPAPLLDAFGSIYCSDTRIYYLVFSVLWDATCVT